MNYTEEQMMEKAKRILKDLQGNFFVEKNLRKVVFNEKRIPIIGEFEGQEIPCWVAVIDEPVFDSTDFLTISDETGEPLYIHGKHSVYEINKDETGKYY